MLVLFLVKSAYTVAQTQTAVMAPDTVAAKKKLTVFPAATYSPETSFSFGAKAILVKRQVGGYATDRPSTHSLTFFYTLRKQVISTLRTDIWRKHNRKHWLGTMNFVNYPYVFYGIGNNTTQEAEEHYTSRALYGSLQFEQKISDKVYLGGLLNFRHDVISKREAEGQLNTGNIVGGAGTNAFGLGPTASYDTRDHLYIPRKGAFHQASVQWFGKVLGSSSNFARYRLDFRKYVPAPFNGVLAGQGLFTFTSGEVPFQYLSPIGGGNILRGYLEARFRDRHAMVYQLEYRVPLFWRVGAAAFAGAGKVAPTLEDLNFRGLHPAAGAGLRFRLNDEGINLRIDMALSEEMPGVYFSLYEAF